MTTSNSAFDFHLNRPGALIAAIPAVLGFVPEKSLVLVTVIAGEMGAVMRVDLSESLTDGLDHLADMAAAGSADAVIAVVVDKDGIDCSMCVDAYRTLSRELGASLGDQGIELYGMHVVDRVEAGGRWQCADTCGNAGIVEDPASSPVTMAAVLDGRRLYARRSELVEVITTTDVNRTESLRGPIEKYSETMNYVDRDDAEVRADVEHAMACAERVGAGGNLTGTNLVRLACTVRDTRVRDTLYGLAVGEDAGAAESLWALLSRTLPELWRIEALVLLAFSAYARGDGPLAGVSLEAALGIDPKHRMASMLDTALQTGMRPDQIRQLGLTGYRLGNRLGVNMPPRRTFGRSA
ncbi:DUF4192 domain-containing protein [Mycobacterium sp. OTB74]|jgi:hypothetical protein|uniref:DUF4192 domain-containing protein n=1 Tax=Mycobacterium sp. OTB74 TaxID=1853452 RepID=UPI0024731CCC|nr:DUF4192 domain-containing protein [Mycobacterium sp. OTB74]MDH6246724.1 hypothetical protein [Mycobacterium sp. OTB74]